MSKLMIDTMRTLNNGVQIPILGLGTSETSPYVKEQTKIFLNGIEAGYRMLDTAWSYQTERGVAEAIKASGLPREHFFITSKLASLAIHLGEREIIRNFEDSLRNLQTDYIDLYMIHWPPHGMLQKTWKLMEYFYYSGHVRAIGISNCKRRDWLEVLMTCNVKPQVQQDEFNPLRMNEYNRIFCEEHGIYFEAFSPLQRNGLSRNPVLLQLAEKYDKDVSQIILRWDIQHGVTPCPRSANRAHIFSNADIFDFELSVQDMARIDSLNVEAISNRDMDNFNF